MTRGDEIVPAVTHSTNDGPAVGLGDGDATLADYEARGGLALLRDLPVAGEHRRGAEGLRSHRLRRRRLPDRDEVGGGRARARSSLRRRQRRRGRAGDDQGPLRHGAPAAPHGRGDRARDARARRPRGLHLPARGVRHGSRAARAGARRVPDGRAPRRALARARRRRRRVHRRRGDGDARVDGGPPRDAEAQASVPEPGRIPRTADADPERRDARPHPGDPPERRRVVGGARDARREGHAALVGHGRGRQARLLRGCERR